MKRFRILRGIGFFTLALALGLLAGLVVMSLWNWLIPELFAGPVVTFWQALGLLLLSKILFGGFGRGWQGGARGARHAAWQRRMDERWKLMTPEQRSQMRQRWRGRCVEGWQEPAESVTNSTPNGNA